MVELCSPDMFRHGLPTNAVAWPLCVVISCGGPRRYTIERVAELKRWLDPMSVGCGFLWMALHILAEPMLEFQLRKAPLPVDMWSRWPQLRRPIAILVVSLLMATAAVWLR
ncbi:hypothetical protein [Sphingomonas aurantiaca]|uniref:hypothetical protein n=1 Tax=Sphingomonas aurantiaca TaxID=185949 RepID=UPI00335F7C65